MLVVASTIDLRSQPKRLLLASTKHWTIRHAALAIQLPALTRLLACSSPLKLYFKKKVIQFHLHLVKIKMA